MENNFGSKLKTLRKKAGFTQESLAEQINVSVLTIKRWESNKNSPRVNEIKKICEALNVSEEELLSGKKQNDEWIVEVKFANTKKEVFDLAQGMPCISEVLTGQYGADIHIAGAYEIYQDDNKFKNLIKQLKEARKLVLLNGKAIGAIKN